MARLLYAVSPADFAALVDAEGDLAPGVGSELVVASTADVADRLTTGIEQVQPDGSTVPTDVLTADAQGRFAFYATDVPSRLWVALWDSVAGAVDSGWYAVLAQDVAARVDAAATASSVTALTTRVTDLETRVTALEQTAGSATYA